MRTRPRYATPADTSKAVAAFMLALDHPFKKEIEVLRRVILTAHPSIAEGIKWNAPSFRTTEYFVTFHLRAKAGIGIILHLGARLAARRRRRWTSRTPADCFSGWARTGRW